MLCFVCIKGTYNALFCMYQRYIQCFVLYVSKVHTMLCFVCSKGTYNALFCMYQRYIQCFVLYVSLIHF